MYSFFSKTSNGFPTKHNQPRHLAMLPRGEDLPGGGLPQADGPVPPLPPVLVLVDPMEREGDEALNERAGPSWGRLEDSSCWGFTLIESRLQNESNLVGLSWVELPGRGMGGGAFSAVRRVQTSRC